MPHPQITPVDLDRAEQWARLYGSANGWAGTNGSVAATVLRLVQAERVRREAMKCGPLAESISHAR